MRDGWESNSRVIPEKFSFKRTVLAVLFFLLLFSFNALAFQSHDCDEVPITLSVKHLGRTELPSFLCNQEVYFSVMELFDFLEIKNVFAGDFTLVEGFIRNQEDIFKIDGLKNELFYKGVTFKLAEHELIRTQMGLFMRSQRFEEIFGLKSDFNPRLLAASMQANFELPSIKAAHRAEMRLNLKKMQQDITADTVIYRDRPLIHFGTADWNVITTQRTDGLNYNRLSLGVGGLLVGGEFQGIFNYSSSQELSLRNQFYRWQYVNNENRFFKQITAGKLSTRSIASIFHPVHGIQVTNAPTYIKRSFGTYVLSDYTQPNWEVELYINNVLIDYAQADSSGFFSFDVPLMYGNTEVSLRFYGPWGEEEVSNAYFKIPFNFLSPGEFQYSLSSGLVEDEDKSLYAKARLDYGLTSRITLGAGVEVLSSLEQSPVIPFLNSSIRLPGNIFLSGEYLHEVGFKGSLSYATSSNLRIDLDYKNFEKEQDAVRFNYLEEKKATLSFPLNYGNLHGTSRFVFRQNLLPNSTFTNLEWLLSGRVLGMRMNITNNAFFNTLSDPLIFSRISASILLPESFVLSPQLEYEYLNKQIANVNVEVRKKLFRKVNFQASYNHNFKFGQFSINAGLNMELDFARVGLNSSANSRYSSFSQSAGGSVFVNLSEDYVKFGTYSTLGRGSIKFKPFLDTNGNGRMDGGESSVEGVNVHLKVGGRKKQLSDGATVFESLEPYISYHFSLDTRNLDRIAWQIEHETMKIFVNPNQLKVVEIPIKVVGEIAGYVYNGDKEIGGIRINIYDQRSELVQSMVSDGDGYFSYLGLESGVYTARVNESQLERLRMEVNEELHFSINNTREGDYIDNLEFILSELYGNEVEQIEEIEVEKPFIVQAESEQVTKEIVSEKTIVSAADADSAKPGVIVTKDLTRKIQEEKHARNDKSIVSNTQDSIENLRFKVQIMASKPRIPLTDSLFHGLEGIQEQRHEGLYKYYWSSSNSFREANQIKNQLRAEYFPDAFVVPFNKETRLNPSSVEPEEMTKESISETKQGVLNSKDVVKKVQEEKQVKNENRVTSKIQNSDGLRFWVQIMASKPRMSLRDSLFHGLEGIQEQRHEGLYKYLWSSSNSFREANQIKNQLRTEYFPDAFVVPYYNGVRLSSQAESEAVEKENIPEETVVSAPDKDVTKGVLNTKDVDGKIQEEKQVKKDNRVTSKAQNSDGLRFWVQIMASKPRMSLRDSLFHGLEGIKEQQHEGLYKYLWSSSNSFREANQIKNQLRAEYFPDAFVVPYYNGVRLSSQAESEAVVKESISGKTVASTPDKDSAKQGVFAKNNNRVISKTQNSDGLRFWVQIMASKTRMSLKDPLFHGLEGIQEQEHEGLYKYLWSSSNSFREANQIKNQLRAEYFPDAFVVPFYYGMRMSRWQAEGSVKLKEGQLSGIGGIRIDISDANDRLFTLTLTEADGSFVVPGLRPGKYTARLNMKQLEKLNMKSATPEISFRIDRKTGVNIVHLEFILESTAKTDRTTR